MIMKLVTVMIKNDDDYNIMTMLIATKNNSYDNMERVIWKVIKAKGKILFFCLEVLSA